MTKGKVKWYNKKRGFGLIEFEKKEFFFHHSEIIGTKNLREDDNVHFEEGVDKNNKVCALKVKLIKKRRPKNTQNFNPSHKPTEMRVIFGDPKSEKFNRVMQSRDVTLVNGLFCDELDLTIYNNLLNEIRKCDKDKNLFKMWHGDSHYIVDDNLDWKKHCPTFMNILKKVEDYFDMEIQATRFNWYENSDHWNILNFSDNFT
jgi:cold shock CspA family protein